MSKYVKNVTDTEIVVRGIPLPPNELVPIPVNVEKSWAMDENVAELIISGSIKIHTNNSTPISGYFNQISLLLDSVRTSLGHTKVSPYEPEGAGATIVTHNYSDKCSWFTGSVQILNETYSLNSESSIQLPHTHIIDLKHGRVYDEDNILIETSNKYSVVVSVDDVVKLEDSLYPTTQRFYSVNYETGLITFNAPVTGSVKVSYHYANKSYYSVRPRQGKILSIKVAEVQCSKTTTIPAPFVFEVWFNHPQYGMVPVPGTRLAYKNAKDFISACNEGQGLIPKWGELTQDVHVFPFNYARPKAIKYSDNAEIRVYCMNDIPTGGEYATATFYVTIEDE